MRVIDVRGRRRFEVGFKTMRKGGVNVNETLPHAHRITKRKPANPEAGFRGNRAKKQKPRSFVSHQRQLLASKLG